MASCTNGGRSTGDASLRGGKHSKYAYIIEAIAREKLKQAPAVPDFSKLRPVVFGDTKLASINWQKQKNAVIKRVFSYGNETEQQEITRFYGEELIRKVLKDNGN